MTSVGAVMAWTAPALPTFDFSLSSSPRRPIVTISIHCRSASRGGKTVGGGLSDGQAALMQVGGATARVLAREDTPLRARSAAAANNRAIIVV